MEVHGRNRPFMDPFQEGGVKLFHRFVWKGDLGLFKGKWERRLGTAGQAKMVKNFW
jgi:hypothetical protein